MKKVVFMLLSLGAFLVNANASSLIRATQYSVVEDSVYFK